jgi:hypothetical protein
MTEEQIVEMIMRAIRESNQDRMALLKVLKRANKKMSNELKHKKVG